MEEASDSFRSTSSSGRSEAGKNCWGTKRNPTIEAANAARVRPIVSHLERMAAVHARRKLRKIRPGSVSVASFILSGRMVTPIRGANRTATIQERRSANATTAKSENVYSPAALFAKPIGTKPATVTNVPVNIGNAVEV